MALFKVCSRTVTQRIVTQRVVAPAFLTIRRNFGIKDTLDKYRDSGTTAFEDGMDTLEKEVAKLKKQPLSPPVPLDLGPGDPKLEKKLDKALEEKPSSESAKAFQWPTFEEGDTKADSKESIKRAKSDYYKKVIESMGVKESTTQEFDIHMGEMKTKPGMTIEEAQKVAEEVYKSWPKDHSLPVDDVLPFAEKMKAADLDGSYGPAKAEFDSWKRIYKEEEQFERLGLPPRAHYWRDGEMYAPYGTLSNPVKIYSQFANRIVGCHGGNGQPHEIAWINLGNKYKTMCPECGQMFMLVNFHPKEHEEPGEDLHDISKTQNDGHLKEPQLY